MRKKTHDDELSTIIENCCDARRRIIYLCKEINDESAAKFLIAFQKLDSTNGTINIVLNTPGGYCTDGWAMYDAIRGSRNHVMIVGMGSVQSMGAILLQAADTRALAPNVEFMIHDVSLDPGELRTHEMKVTYEAINAMNERGARVLAERSGQDADRVREWLKEEKFLSAKEAVDLGFADTIALADKKKGK